MDWTEVSAFIAIIIAVGGVVAWGYTDLRSSIRFTNSTATKGIEDNKTAIAAQQIALGASDGRVQTALAANEAKLQAQMHAFMVEMMRAYIPKEEVLRIENRIMDAIKEIHQKLDQRA